MENGKRVVVHYSCSRHTITYCKIQVCMYVYYKINSYMIHN